MRPYRTAAECNLARARRYANGTGFEPRPEPPVIDTGDGIGDHYSNCDRVKRHWLDEASRAREAGHRQLAEQLDNMGWELGNTGD